MDQLAELFTGTQPPFGRTLSEKEVPGFVSETSYQLTRMEIVMNAVVTAQGLPERFSAELEKDQRGVSFRIDGEPPFASIRCNEAGLPVTTLEGIMRDTHIPVSIAIQRVGDEGRKILLKRHQNADLSTAIPASGVTTVQQATNSCDTQPEAPDMHDAAVEERNNSRRIGINAGLGVALAGISLLISIFGLVSGRSTGQHGQDNTANVTFLGKPSSLSSLPKGMGACLYNKKSEDGPCNFYVAQRNSSRPENVLLYQDHEAQWTNDEISY
jgi:hypothetical protein